MFSRVAPRWVLRGRTRVGSKLFFNLSSRHIQPHLFLNDKLGFDARQYRDLFDLSIVIRLRGCTPWKLWWFAIDPPL